MKEKEPGTSEDENRGEVATQLWEKLGDILTLTAQQTEALQAYQNGLDPGSTHRPDLEGTPASQSRSSLAGTEALFRGIGSLQSG